GVPEQSPARNSTPSSDLLCTPRRLEAAVSPRSRLPEEISLLKDPGA
ncbi:hypothetical protein LEMLEM_LOCUS8808, partial [Lemmus lemmus]